MFILHRISRTDGQMTHSTQFFDIDIPTDGKLPQEVKNRLYAVCTADGTTPSIDYAMVQVVDENGAVWRTEIVKEMPKPEQV